MLCGSCFAIISATTAAQSPPNPGSAQRTTQIAAVSGNPAATTFSTSTGWLGRTLGLQDGWGITLGGLWLADTNLVAGGAQPGGWTNNSALLIGLGIDAEKLVGWRGASFGFQFLQFNGANTNGEAGSIAGYNGIVALPPHQRTELFEAWYAQEMIKDVLQVRIGRTAPTLDFNNVLRPVTFADGSQNIPAVSGLLYSTIFVNGSLLGVLPGYYNSGNGVTVNFTPTRSFGTNWVIGGGHHPGQFGIGLWRQTGVLTAAGISQDGTGGVYLFASQRIAHGINERVPSSAITTFYQFGINDSQTLPINQYYGAGMTAFGLIGDRQRDSMGFGAGLSRLNPHLFVQPSELMLQAYYQAHLFATTFLQPTVSDIPTPGASPTLPGALTTTLRLTVLF